MFPTIDRTRTGKRILFWMKINNLTPRDIQNYLSLSCVQTVYRWLDGSNIPTIDNLYALSRLFRINVNAMIVGDDIEKCAKSAFLKQTYAYWVLFEAGMVRFSG